MVPPAIAKEYGCGSEQQIWYLPFEIPLDVIHATGDEPIVLTQRECTGQLVAPHFIDDNAVGTCPSRKSRQSSAGDHGPITAESQRVLYGGTS